MMSKKEIFCRKIFNKEDQITWFDTTGVIKLDDDRNAEITLKYSHVMDNYDMFTVKIISKTNGLIVAHNFKFDDYLSKDMADRTDNRSDYTGSFLMMAHCGADKWYIAVPNDRNKRNYTRAVLDYIERYK